MSYKKKINYFSTILKYVNEAIARMENNKNAEPFSALERLLKVDSNSSAAIVIVIDLILAGIETVRSNFSHNIQI